MLGPGPDHLLDGLAVTEDEQGRHGQHPVPGDGSGVAVRVDLHDLEPVGLLGGDRGEDGGELAARAAPVRRELHEDGPASRSPSTSASKSASVTCATP